MTPMRAAFFAALAALPLGGCAPDPLASLNLGVAAEYPTYRSDIEPLYARHCSRCHGEDGRMDGGVELDSYVAARSTRVRSACVSIGADVIDTYADVLLPSAGYGDPVPCADWSPFSMPPGASVHLTLDEQLTLARWVELGGPE